MLDEWGGGGGASTAAPWFSILIYECLYTKVDVIKMKMKVFSEIEFEFLEYHFVKDGWAIKWFENS